MSVIRIEKTKDYTVMSNHHFRNRDMSLKAKGLLSIMLSLPDEWDYSIKGLVMLSKDGSDSVNSAIKELEQFGYIKREQAYDDKGRFCGYDYTVYENPLTETPLAENPLTENHEQLNTNKSNTKELNNKYNIYIVEIVNYLNEKAGTRYNPKTKQTIQHIKARLDEGYTVDDFKTVIDKKCSEWLGTEWEGYLRPNTLFAGKFESYLNAPVRRGANTNGYVTTTEDYDADFERC